MKFANFVVLVAYGVALGLSEEKRGPLKRARVIKGIAARRTQFPFQAYLHIYNSTKSTLCGGSLLSDQYVLTAAHCLDKATGAEVYLGIVDTSKFGIEQQQYFHSLKNNIKIHEKYNLSGKLDNDIALIKLTTSAQFNEYVQPVNLPNKSDVARSYVDQIVVAVGWGKTNDKPGSYATMLQFMRGPVISNAECTPHYIRGWVQPTNICVRAKDRSGTCSGDSGGPLLLADSPNTIIGITSFGRIGTCETGYPDAFTRVTSYLTWIERNTNIKIS